MTANEPSRYGDPVRYADGAALTVEARDGLVQLVTRAPDGAHRQGVELAPSEAQQLGQALIAAAFASRPQSGATPSRPGLAT
ncbi:hypothetical protein [Dermacoccus sp. PE3]|uniref:hypothetical protein n=1 Tax=Dermacoccus sp. PE3 TaxID=1641401 RepID=UPI000AEE8447|nr:hypothetical protein [Dermacoccus sp. PE3]